METIETPPNVIKEHHRFSTGHIDLDSIPVGKSLVIDKEHLLRSTVNSLCWRWNKKNQGFIVTVRQWGKNKEKWIFSKYKKD